MDTLFDLTLPPRSPDALRDSALAVLTEAMQHAKYMAPLFSGGHDSLCACHLASQHPAFGDMVHHIDTGIGAKSTRQFVNEVCKEFGWELAVWKSSETYEKFVRERGFAGPGMHQWAYNRLKDRCVYKITARKKVALITGCRQQESTRRMGHVEPIKIGETSKKTGRVYNTCRIWTAPCFDWSTAEQVSYMNEHDLPRNPLKERLGMSGECFCGAFASPNEIEMIRRYAPDVAAEIDRLSLIAAECGKHDVWGTRPPREKKGIILAQTGPLCSGCDRRAAAAGLLFEAS